MTKKRIRRPALALVAAAATMVLAACGGGGGGGGDASPGGGAATGEEPASDAAAEFYDGKTVTFIVPYNPGGGFDTFVRILAPLMEEELEGARVRVENRPGGGGLIGANEVFQAEPDGLTIGLINYPGSVFAEATGQEGTQFENSEWTFLGRLGAINPIVYTGEDSGLPTFESIIESEEPVKFGIGGVGSDAFYATVVMGKVLDFPTDIVTGYEGGPEADAALLAGEVQASVGSVDASLTRIEGTGTNITALISNEPNSAVPDVPLITEFGEGEQQEILTALATIYDLERVVVGPPGIDEQRANYLAEAMFAAATGGDYEKEMAEAGYTVNPLSREDTVQLAEDAAESTELLTPLVK